MNYSRQVQVREVRGFREFRGCRVPQETRHLLVGPVHLEPPGRPETNTAFSPLNLLSRFTRNKEPGGGGQVPAQLRTLVWTVQLTCQLVLMNTDSLYLLSTSSSCILWPHSRSALFRSHYLIPVRDALPVCPVHIPPYSRRMLSVYAAPCFVSCVSFYFVSFRLCDCAASRCSWSESCCFTGRVVLNGAAQKRAIVETSAWREIYAQG